MLTFNWVQAFRFMLFTTEPETSASFVNICMWTPITQFSEPFAISPDPQITHMGLADTWELIFPITAEHQKAHPSICQTALDTWFKNWIKPLLFSRFSFGFSGITMWLCYAVLKKFPWSHLLQLWFRGFINTSVRFHYSVFLEKRILMSKQFLDK